MSVFIASLNSGSNGNCYYVGNENEAVLVDAGISCRETEKRMKRCGLNMEHVKAVFISHEHSDHIRGVETLVKKYQLPVYITEATLNNSRLSPPKELIRTFTENQTIAIGQLQVTPFPKSHDAADPYSFMIEHDGIKTGVITDIGYNCEQVIHYFSQCHAVFLEANYDEQMLEEGGYPFYLKKRIRSNKGHLSNDQSLELFQKHRAPHLKLLLLSHLSKQNNSPELVEKLFSAHAGNTTITVASRYKESDVYFVSHDFPSQRCLQNNAYQTSLF
jgi:phosphoribosyl 1,2-cyclic phosphodiesterase